MSLEELIRYKNMPIENIDRKIVPDIEDIKGKKNIAPLSMYFMKVGNVKYLVQRLRLLQISFFHEWLLSISF